MMIGALFIAGVLALIVGAQTLGYISSPQAGSIADLARWTALLGLIGYAVLRAYRGRMGDVLTSAVIWIGIGVALVGLYSYRFEVQAIARRIGVELAPGGTVVSDGSDVTLRRSARGHYGLDAEVDGRAFPFVIDTGATNTTLSQATAAEMGLDVAALRYTVPVQTANGMTFAAPATLDRLTVGPIAVENLRVLVAKPDALATNLLGLDFLDRLTSYEVKGRTMTLRTSE